MPATATLSINYHPVNRAYGTAEVANDAGMVLGFHIEAFDKDVFFVERYGSQRQPGQAPGYICTASPPACACSLFANEGTCLHAEMLRQLREEGAI